MRSPFSLYKEKTKSGVFWYARFWDDAAGRYLHSRSTGVPVEGKRERRKEAGEAAALILEEMKREAEGMADQPDTTVPAEDPLAPENPANQSFVSFVSDFWTPDSKYVREKKAVDKIPLSLAYIKNNHEDIRRHVQPFPGFAGLTLGGLTRAIIRDWKLWAAESGLSGRKINIVLQAMRVPVRDAYKNEHIDKDPFFNVSDASHTEKEKGILTPAEIMKLLNAPIDDLYSRLAVLLGTICGLRRGEIRGLKWEDIGEGTITIQHNWIDGEGIKAPKRKGGAVQKNKRIVPLPKQVNEVLNSIRQVSKHTKPGDFVMESLRRRGEAISASYLGHAFERELQGIGISAEEKKQRNITPHSMRHDFVTMNRLAGVTDFEIQALAGHKDAKMMNRYSHAEQVIDFNAVKEKLEKVYTPKAAGGNE
jgi:integrase